MRAAVSAERGAAGARHLGARIAALGVAQIVSWGTLFYTIAVLGAPMRAELGIGDMLLFGAFSAGLLISGAASPLVGRLIDAGRAREVLASGSLAGAVALAALALAQGPVSVCAGWMLAGVAMALCLYDPAFATLHHISGMHYRRAITALTLFGGFASTVFWPASQWLSDAAGWRATFGVYAALHIAVCLPLHLCAIPRGARHAEAEPPTEAQEGPHITAGIERTFRWLAIALAGAAFMASAVSAHLIGLMTTSGISAGDAVLIGALIGPMQVAGRVVEFSHGRRLHARTVGTLAFVLLAAALALLTQLHGLKAAAVGFALLYGISNGVMTIVRGTVPAELFGRREFGTLLGRLARPQLIARAVAPVTLTLAFPFDPTRAITVYLLAAGGVVSLLAYQIAIRARGNPG
jgi:predicted MFS family arabinose efflux permease